MSISHSQIKIIHSQMVLERTFAIQRAIIAIIDGTLDNCPL